MNPEAYEAYLRGHEHNNKLTRADLSGAGVLPDCVGERLDLRAGLCRHRACVERTAADGDCSAGRGPASHAGGYCPGRWRSIPPRPSGVHDRLAKSDCRWSDWNWQAGEVEFPARRWRWTLVPPRRTRSYAHFLQIMKRPQEATTQIRKAIELDPLNPQVRAFYAVLLNQDRRFDEGLAQSARS